MAALRTAEAAWTRENVLAAVAKQFRPEDRAVALGLLDGYLGDTPAGRARVQLAILEIAKGDIEQVREYTDHSANVDYRDILHTADLKGSMAAEATRKGMRRFFLLWFGGTAMIVWMARILDHPRPLQTMFVRGFVLSLIAAAIVLFVERWQHRQDHS